MNFNLQLTWYCILTILMLVCKIELIDAALDKLDKNFKRNLKMDDKHSRGTNTYGDMEMKRFNIEAWNCDVPKDIMSQSYSQEENCGKIDDAPKRGRPITATILQEERRRRHKGQACSILETRINLYCGLFSHSTVLINLNRYNVPRKVSYDECKNMIEKNTFVDETGVAHDINKQGLSTLAYVPSGSTWRSSNGGTHCQGEDVFINNKKYSGVVTQVQLVIRIQEEEIWYDPEENKLTTHFTEKVLPCEEDDKHCITQEHTFLWTVDPDSKCMFAKTRVFRGNEFTTSSGQTVILATDGSMNRFVKKGEITRCEETLYTTANPRIFVQIEEEKDYDKTQWRDIHASEASMIMYVQHREEFLFYAITSQMRKEFHQVLLEDCKRQHKLNKLVFYAEHSEPGVQTWSMGNGTFGTMAGDIIYTYECQKEIVYPRRTDRCYQGLPVQRNVFGNWFVEPITHRLTKEGIVIPCTNLFQSKFRTIDGRWVTGGKNVVWATPPSNEKYNDESLADILAKLANETDQDKIDFYTSGIYKSSTVRDAEDYTQFSRMTKAVNYALTKQIGNFQWRKSYILPENIFTDDMHIESWQQRVLGPIISWMRGTGEVASVLVCCYVIGGLLWNIAEWIYKGTILAQLNGCLWGFLAPFMNCLMLHEFRNQKKERKKTKLNRPKRPESILQRIRDLMAKEQRKRRKNKQEQMYADENDVFSEEDGYSTPPNKESNYKSRYNRRKRSSISDVDSTRSRKTKSMRSSRQTSMRSFRSSKKSSLYKNRLNKRIEKDGTFTEDTIFSDENEIHEIIPLRKRPLPQPPRQLLYPDAPQFDETRRPVPPPIMSSRISRTTMESQPMETTISSISPSTRSILQADVQWPNFQFNTTPSIAPNPPINPQWKFIQQKEDLKTKPTAPAEIDKQSQTIVSEDQVKIALAGLKPPKCEFSRAPSVDEIKNQIQ